MADKAILASHLKSHGILLWEYANGMDDSLVISTRTEAKGIGNSTTLPKDVSDRAEAFHCLLSLCDSVSGRLRKAGQLAGMVSVEIKYSDFSTASHQALLSAPSNTSQVIYQASCRLFDELWNGSPPGSPICHNRFSSPCLSPYPNLKPILCLRRSAKAAPSLPPGKNWLPLTKP